MDHTIEVKVSVSVNGLTVTRTATVTTDGEPYTLAEKTLDGVRWSVDGLLQQPRKFNAAAE